MAPVIDVNKYSDDFECAIAEYCTGDTADRGDKTTYELYTKIIHAKSFFEFCRRYFDIKDMRFIEIGCGTGGVSVAAAIMGAMVSATDFVEKPVNLAHLRWSEHDLHGDLFRSDIRGKVDERHLSAFDFVYCYQVLEHIPRHQQFHSLANVFSMVASGGYLFIDTENSLCPFDRHDTNTWLLRYLSKPVYEPILEKLGRSLNFFEPSSGARVLTRDYLSYDELIGAALISGFEVISPFMPHGSKRQYLKILTGSDWLHDSVLENIDIERFSPISILLRKTMRD